MGDPLNTEIKFLKCQNSKTKDFTNKKKSHDPIMENFKLNYGEIQIKSFNSHQMKPKKSSNKSMIIDSY
jgi:hypothetical protein